MKGGQGPGDWRARHAGSALHKGASKMQTTHQLTAAGPDSCVAAMMFCQPGRCVWAPGTLPVGCLHAACELLARCLWAPGTLPLSSRHAASGPRPKNRLHMLVVNAEFATNVLARCSRA